MIKRDSNYKELKKQFKEKIETNYNQNYNVSYLLYDNRSNVVNLSSKISNNLSKNVKFFKILDKSSFYILKIENEIYLIKKEKIKEVKKYIYKNKKDKEIFLSEIIDPKIKEKKFYELEQGLRIKELELINTKDIESIENFNILKFNETTELSDTTNKDLFSNVIDIKNEEHFLKIKEELEFFIRNNTYFKLDNEAFVLLNSLFSITKEKKEKNFFSEYSKLNIVNNYIQIKEKQYEEFINISKLLKITIEKKEIPLKFTDPIGKDFFYKFHILEVTIHLTEKRYETYYCFENDFNKKELMKSNKNKVIKEI